MNDSVPPAGQTAASRPAVRTTGRSGGEGPALQHPADHLGGGREGPGAPCDDLHGAAEALEELDVAPRRPLDLDPVGVHDAAAGEPPATGQGERGALSHDGIEGLGSGHRKPAVETEGCTDGADLSRV